MKEFNPVPFDVLACQPDIDAFDALLKSKPELEENADIKPFFEARPHLAVLIGTVYSDDPAIFDLFAFQYQLFGDFGCDLVVGDADTRTFCFVEWEDATAGSLFRRQGAKATPEWSGRIERGFSQLVDWFWKMEDMSRTDEYATRFGSRHARYFGVLVIGRDDQLTHTREQNRWHWRSRQVSVNGRAVRLVTYDQLYRDLSRFVRRLTTGPTARNE